MLAREYPLAALAALGLAAGLILLPFAPAAARAAFAAVTVGTGAPLVLRTLRQLLRGRLWADAIAALAIVGAALLGEWLAGAVVVLMQSGGEALEDYGLRRANRSLENLLRRAPSTAHVKRDGDFVDVPAAEVPVGSIVLVRTGDILPADGVVVEGNGSVDEAALTGEPVPLPKLPGDKVYSGTISLSGRLLVRTSKPAAESKYELIVRMVQRAQGERAPINRLANRYAPAFTVLALGIAGAAALGSGELRNALAVLVVATPCPLIIATPLAVLTAVNRAASRNIIVKSGAAIEQAAEIRTVVFDKTGTLTVGEPALRSIEILNGADEAEVLAGAAGVELLSSHGMAQAVVRAARDRRLEVRAAAEVCESPGTGAAGVVDGHRYAIGSARFVGAPVASREHEGISSAWVARDGTPVARFVFQDPMRPDAPRLLERLRGLGIEDTVMLTGDAPDVANAIARDVGISQVRARLQPDEKQAIVQELGPDTLMVGDGINDAPALAAAGVGVAMGGHGAGIATDAADVVITVESVERVADVVEIGRRMVRVARQGILFGIGASVALMVIAGLGYIPPTVGAVVQEALDLATILNAVRARS